MNEARLLLEALPLRAKVALAARSAEIALVRLPTSVGKHDRKLLEEGVETCLRVAERDDHGDEGVLDGIGGRAVDLSQGRAHAGVPAKLFDAIAGSCYAAAKYGQWLASSPQRREAVADFVIHNAERSCRGLLGADAAIGGELTALSRRLEAAGRAEGWDDASPVARERLRP